MNDYPEITPIFASSQMRITQVGRKVKFSNVIQYDYIDPGQNTAPHSYQLFLKNPRTLSREIEMYWSNLQTFLDEEQNLINNRRVALTVVHCSIFFRQPDRPCVQWVVEFEGSIHPGKNIYENRIDPETLEYPIVSHYIFNTPLSVQAITSSIAHELNRTKRIIHYSGKTGDRLDGYESITFSWK